MNSWETVFPDARQSMSSLLCSSTNETPHERIFKCSRRIATGQSLPSWLCDRGTVQLKRHARTSKYEPHIAVEQLIEANPHYTYVRFSDGREDTVSIKDLAPTGSFEPALEAANEDYDQPPYNVDLNIVGDGDEEVRTWRYQWRHSMPPRIGVT